MVKKRCVSPMVRQPNQLWLRKYGGFLKWWYPTTIGFPTEKWSCWGDLGIPPFMETPISRGNDVKLAMIPPVRIAWIAELFSVKEFDETSPKNFTGDAPPKTNMVHLKISSFKGKNIYKNHQVLGFHVSFQGCTFLDHLFPIVFVKPHLPGHLCEEDLACSESNASRAWKRGDGGNVPVILCGNSHGPRSW